MRDPLELYWLPQATDFPERVAALSGPAPAERLKLARDLANSRLDFAQTLRLDRAFAKGLQSGDLGQPGIRLAMIGAATLDHLGPGIRVACLRRGLVADVWAAPYGQWQQQILDPASELYRFKPDAVLLSLTADTLLPPEQPGLPAPAAKRLAGDRVDELRALWRTLAARSNAALIQQTILDHEPPAFGHLERRTPGSRAWAAGWVDTLLTEAAAEEGVLLLDLQRAASAIHDPGLWHHAKQEIAPAAMPWAGEQVGRILAGLRGLSRKALVLDLDNTLWGGVIGDDGLDGIVLGQGSAAGEAFAALQRYLKRLAARGVLLAVSSKNDMATAQAAFRDHPEMILRPDDIAVFEANWQDKPSAMRRIAEALNLGLDSLAFLDDNPAERALMRRTLPEVATPELPDAPELYAGVLADAGLFEPVAFTADDRSRGGHYAANARRAEAQQSSTDLEGFIRDLDMTLTVGRFQTADLARITQLINKTNQFNLTTRRRTEPEVRALLEDDRAVTLAARLTDRFGDNGLICVVIGRKTDGDELELDTWLMSCRVIGRRVEDAVLAAIADLARQAGCRRLIGRYVPTARNALVKDLYSTLGFRAVTGLATPDGETVWTLELDGEAPAPAHLTLMKAW